MTYEVWFFLILCMNTPSIHKIKKYFEKVSKKQLIGPQKESFWGSILLNFTQLHWIHKKTGKSDQKISRKKINGSFWTLAGILCPNLGRPEF